MTTVMLSGVFWKAPSPLGLLASAGRPRQCVLVTCQHSPPRGKLQRLLVEKEQSPHCWIYFLSFRAAAGRLCRTVGGSVLKRLCSWQPFPCAHTASLVSRWKIPSFDAGIICHRGRIRECTSFAASPRNSQRERDRR